MMGRLSSYFIRMTVLKVSGKTVPCIALELSLTAMLKLGHVGGHVGLAGSMGQRVLRQPGFRRKQCCRERVT